MRDGSLIYDFGYTNEQYQVGRWQARIKELDDTYILEYVYKCRSQKSF
jgi:hypothetical protein